jgi:hypothetical protein
MLKSLKARKARAVNSLVSTPASAQQWRLHSTPGRLSPNAKPPEAVFPARLGDGFFATSEQKPVLTPYPTVAYRLTET